MISFKNETAVFALGGLGEVGKNTYCIEHDDSLIIIDAGVKFPEDELLGIDYVIPDYTYLVRNQYKIKALIITHGHEDHIGGLPFLLQKIFVPVIYAPRLAAALIKHKLEEHKVREKVKVVEINGDSSLDIGPFKVDFFSMTHSIPDAYGVSINTPNGRIVTTGDFKIDLTPVGQPIDLHKIAALASEGITLLMSDSTNAEVDGLTISEKAVVASVNDVFRNTPGRLIVATFASNIFRIQQIIEAAIKFKRRILVFGRSMEKTIAIGRQYGYIKCPDNYFITPEALRQYRPEELLILCTGSQGEPLAALSRIANDTHKYLKILPGDTVVFSSSPIPGNAISVSKVVNNLIRRGANVLTNSVFSNLHTSGHASKEDLKFMLALMKPRYFMPVHGEYRMLKIHAEIAHSLGMPPKNTFVLANGDVLLLKNGEVHRGRRVESDDIYVDGKDSSGLSTAVIRDRKILSTDGVVAVLISMDSRENKLICPPKIIARGFMYIADNSELIKEAQDIVHNALNELFKGKVTFSDLKNTIRTSCSSFIYNHTNRNPIIVPIIMNKRETKDENAETVTNTLLRPKRRKPSNNVQ